MDSRTITRAKLSGSTVLEVVVALVIIMIVFVLTTRIFLQTIKSSASINHFKAHALLEKLEWECRAKQDLATISWDEEYCRITKDVSRYSEEHHLWKVKLIASEKLSDKVLVERVFLVYEKP